jgi:uncharacterized protein
MDLFASLHRTSESARLEFMITTSSALNSLARASSAYLRSAMHQPIQWHEWGEEAFAAARRENKPMLLDIGAVWCHWCHVMDRESYDDPEIAAIVNENFVAVKVDRDERPDIDSRYQAAVQAVSGQGGWPLTVFLTPDGKPFYGGTYFPPQDGYGRPSFRRVLMSIANAYKEKHGDVVEQAAMVESTIAQSESFAGRDGKISAGVIAAIQESALKMFDTQHGGFGQAPKFPHPSVLDLLIERYSRMRSLVQLGSAGQPRAAVPTNSEPSTDSDLLRDVIVMTLERMANGGVYDQLAGGFHRYSVDERWVVPHFEKMCYDNSELLKNYVHAYQATGEKFFAEVARDMIRWIDAWLSDRERGGFYASQDADINMDDDGDYFTWTLDEARAVLTEEEAQAAALHYDINEIGEMHHNPAKNVLFVRASVDEIAKRLNLTTEKVNQLLASAKNKLYAARLQRPTPYVDKTVYVAWNSLCISAYLEAAKVLDLAEAQGFALRSLDRVLREAWKPEREQLADEASAAQRGMLLHVIAYSDPKAELRKIPGMLEDYAFTALACLDAYEATGHLTYFRSAKDIADAMIARFYDATSGGFFDSDPGADGQSLGVMATRRKPLQDSPTPAGNPMAAIALIRLHHYTGDADYRDKAEQTLEVFGGVAPQFGIFAATYGTAVVHWLESPVQTVVIGEDDAAKGLEAAARARFAFSLSVLRLAANQAIAENLPPALAATIPNLPQLHSGKSFAVLCSGSTCQPPITDTSELRRSLAQSLKTIA